MDYWTLAFVLSEINGMTASKTKEKTPLADAQVKECIGQSCVIDRWASVERRNHPELLRWPGSDRG